MDVISYITSNEQHASSTHSNNTLASLTFPAIYGDPPLSGWFANMSVRWASFSRLKVIGSLGISSVFVMQVTLFREVAGYVTGCVQRQLRRHSAETHRKPKIWIASDRSIFILKPPRTNFSAPFAPLISRKAVSPANPAPSVPRPRTSADAMMRCVCDAIRCCMNWVYRS